MSDEDRQQLLKLLRTKGILHRTATQPVLSRDGTPARWMLDSLNVTLTPEGASLAARCLLAELESFEGRQLATYGLTGIPLMQSCLVLGDGRYLGALIRKEPKKHGSLKVIEGELDPAEPVVIVDDSVSSGLSMWNCANTLEQAGFHVEGGVTLVRFRYLQGTALLIRRGLRMATVFDIDADFIRQMDGEPPRLANPTKMFGPLTATGVPAAEGLHPAALARAVIAEYLRSGRVLDGPASLDDYYDAAGGCWVSLRRRTAINRRPARDGFWHFPGEAGNGAPRDVVLAAVRTARQLQAKHDDAQEVLDECAIAVTFFTALEQCTVGELDNERYGIVVRSADRDATMGGALPRMPGIANEWQQFWHAARRNAKLEPLEPYRLYRHDVRKAVEPGVTWQPTGAPDSPRTAWPEHAARVLARGARLHIVDTAAPSESVELPDHIIGLFVTVYADGKIVGCTGSYSGDLAAKVPALAEAALHDSRFGEPSPDAEIAVGVSLLANAVEIGAASPDWVTHPIRFGEQALRVRQGTRDGFLLPGVAMMRSWTRRQYVDEVIDKAGITRAPYHWTRYDCATWIADRDGERPIVDGLPAVRDPEPGTANRLRELLTEYTLRVHTSTEPPVNRYQVFADRLRTGVLPARLAYGAWVKARAGLATQCAEDLDRLTATGGSSEVEDHPPSIATAAFTVLAQLHSGIHVGDNTIDMLWSAIDIHGRITTHRDGGHDRDQDYAPGQVLMALAAAAQREMTDIREPDLRRAFRYYRMRFRQNHSWGAVTWLTQAFSWWAVALDDPSTLSDAYEIADWALGFQSVRSGAFLNDHQADTPGATTALYLEAVAAVRAAAHHFGHSDRETRYAAALSAGIGFLGRLVYLDAHRAVLPNPGWARGGIRMSLTSSDIRTDYVHHALSAVLGSLDTEPYGWSR
ncbi:orotate phosphoribosyltransferase/AMMECR1 domain-containing protein [Mycobacterium sp. OAS707]|uniref:AMMECR1 domain-containing protein n=1 Tax=Mycobacterium sp. OAS707 TaxID=2663822 RepID=UPI001789F365|nr:orotate phosphoribosyltransferase/AMMECR1 domain-containing protein [Mycobacterium sp. OAS707]